MGAGLARLSPSGTIDRRVAVPCAVAGIGLLAALGLLYSKRRRNAFEFGSLDLRTMHRKSERELHGVSKRGEDNAKVEFTSLIPEVLQDLEEAGGTTAPDAMSAKDELDYRAKALASVGAPPFKQFLKQKGAGELLRSDCKVLQLNIGLYCNQACTHCHVESSPLRTEMSSDDVINRIIYLLRSSPGVTMLDITGGAPEMNNGFRRLVEGAAALRDSGERPKLRILDRCNLTVLLEPGQEDLPEFLKKHRVDVVASLPSYDADQTDKQRGRKVFERSVQGLKMLNDLGYGKPGSGLRMDLVFNPPGAFLPPKQAPLQAKYKKELMQEHSIEFNHLLTIANMPVKRFFDHLRKTGTLEGYMDLLVRNFNPETVPLVMCRDTVNVEYTGKMFDCDFNQQLDLGIGGGKGLTIFDIETLHDEKLRKAAIATRAHCFGCTAAQGSG